MEEIKSGREAWEFVPRQPPAWPFCNEIRSECEHVAGLTLTQVCSFCPCAAVHFAFRQRVALFLTLTLPRALWRSVCSCRRSGTAVRESIHSSDSRKIDPEQVKKPFNPYENEGLLSCECGTRGSSFPGGGGGQISNLHWWILCLYVLRQSCWSPPRPEKRRCRND